MRALPLLAAAALVLAVAGCAAPARPGGSGGPSGRVVVLAAASLTEAFERVAAGVEAEHDGLDVVLSFGGSGGLVQQVLAGAPADVLATASSASLAPVLESGDAADPRVLARNRLQLAVPPDDPGRVRGLADLARPELAVALCAPTVPCGAATQALLSASGVEAAPDTLEQDVRAVLAKVRLGEVDAGLVYRTDVVAAGAAVRGVDVPEVADAVNAYPVVVLSQAPNPRGAAVFLDALLSEAGRAVLLDAGFDAP